jgi:hypothetical protein
MSEFVRIRNRAGIVDRRRLEKLGLSTKRDNSDSIGQFGSGAKLAPIAAIRKGIRWITVCSDDEGEYRLEFTAKEVDGIETVFYSYGDYEKESSFTVDAGVLSWDEDFQIFREAFANALDEGEHWIDLVEIDDEVFPYTPGYVDVFLSAAPEIMEIINHFDQYFTVKRAPLVENAWGSIYQKSNSDVARIYNKTVFVTTIGGSGWDHESGRPIHFDWGFDDLILNEERRVKSLSDVEYSMVRVVAHVKDDFGGRKFIKDALKNEPDEFTNFLDSYSVSGTTVTTLWAEMYCEVFGDKSVPIVNDMASQIISENLVAIGYSPRVVSKFLHALLMKSGVKSAQEILGDRASIKIIDCPPEYVEMFEAAKRTVFRYDPRLSNYKVSVMKPEGSTSLGLFVRGGTGDEIYISTLALEEGMRCVVETLIHELDHAVTGAADYTRQFRDVADKRIAGLLFDHGYDIDITLERDTILIPVSYMSRLGSLQYRILGTDTGSILVVGDQRFFINATLEDREGVMRTTEDDVMAIDALGIGSWHRIVKV